MTLSIPRAAFVCLVLLSTLAQAGPLTPPAGPVAPTPGPEPRIAVNALNTPESSSASFVISQPGSYYLERNLLGVANKHGIEITSGNVTLDLNGYSVIGVGAGSGAFNGVTAVFTAEVSGVTVRNGTVRSWGGHGVSVPSTFLKGALVEAVHASSNSLSGFNAGSGAVFDRCTASQNGTNGFQSGTNVIFTNCVASENASGGFLAGSACVFRGCTAMDNSGDGYSTTNACSFESCTAHSNQAQFGFDVGVACTFTSCTASQNTSALSTSAGFECSGGCVFTACMSYNNVSTSATPGPATGAGFIIGTGSTITGCAAATNRGDGIRANDRCHIYANKVNEAGFGGTGAAIRATGDQCRVEANHCSTSDVGFDIEGTGNFIIRNTSVNNSTDYSIGVNNFYGPIIDRTAAAGQAVNGPSAGGNLNTSDPNANFSR